MSKEDLIIRADAEEEEEKKEDAQARSDEALKHTIADAVADAMKPAMDAATRCMDAAEKCMDRMDRMDARMDAMGRKDNEEEEEERDDGWKRRQGDKKRGKADAAAKTDSDGEEEEAKGEPEPPAADKKRRDEETAPESTKVDAKRRDEEEEKEEKKEDTAHADADMAALRAQVADLTTRLGRQEMITPIPMTDEAAHAMLEQQAHADEVFSQLGERAPPPLVNETLSTYRRRLLRKLSPYSDSLKDIKWEAINDDVALKELESKVYADAVHHANNPASIPAGILMPLTERTPTGHTITRYRGDSSAWMLPMAGAVTQHVKEFLNT